MIRYLPFDRASIADIIGHPWVTNPDVPTDQEVIVECIEKRKLVEEQRQ